MRSTIRQTFILLALAALPALVTGLLQIEWRRHEPLQPGEVRPATARLWGNHVVWVDARSRRLFDTKHIPRAILLNPEEWERQVPVFYQNWNADKTVVVYDEGSGSPTSAAIAARIREELKVESVYVLKGGWRAWRE